MNLNNGIFLQTHLSEEDNKVYEDIIKYLFDDATSNYIFFNTNKQIDLKNINNLNHIYNEYCTLYYIYENKLYEKYDTVSLGHYRRIPNVYLINEYKINHNEIQYYDHVCFRNKLSDNINNIHKETLNKIELKYKDYWYLCTYFMFLDYPFYILEDLINYLKQQTIIDQNKIKNKCSINNSCFLFIGRTMFTCNKTMFINMMKFINGYINYLGNKYHYNLFDYTECVNFINFYLIEYLRKNFDNHINNINIIKNNVPEMNRYNIFQHLIFYKEIFNIKTNYGLNTYCNNWRFFGYTIEWLVNLFINCNSYFNTSQMSKFIINDNKKIFVNVFKKTLVYDKLINLHINNI